MFSCDIYRYSAVISKMLKYSEINILNIPVEHLDFAIEHTEKTQRKMDV